MDEKFVNHFIEATIKVLETMAFTTPTVGETCLWDADKSVADVVSIVGLSNEDETIQGFFSIGFTEASILQIVSSMFGEEFESMSDEIRDAVGEIANMISGQTRQALAAMGIKLQAALPTIIAGKELVLEGAEHKPLTMVAFMVEKGPFELGICIEGLP